MMGSRGARLPFSSAASSSRTFGLNLTTALTTSSPVRASPTMRIPRSGSSRVRQAERPAFRRSVITTLMGDMIHLDLLFRDPSIEPSSYSLRGGAGPDLLDHEKRRLQATGDPEL